MPANGEFTGVSADEAVYDPERFARVKHAGGLADDEFDGCGTSEKGQVCILRIDTGQGKRGFPYHGLDGIDDEGDRFTLMFRSTHGWGDKTLQGFWKVTVAGRRLDGVIRQIALGRRTTLRPGGSADGDKPYVSGITMEPFTPDDPDDEEPGGGMG